MGFEPTNELPRYSISNAAPSTTRPPLQTLCLVYHIILFLSRSGTKKIKFHIVMQYFTPERYFTNPARIFFIEKTTCFFTSRFLRKNRTIRISIILVDMQTSFARYIYFEIRYDINLVAERQHIESARHIENLVRDLYR